MSRQYFGTDGVRGIVGEDLTTDLVERLGKAATLWSDGGRVFVGRDTRASGPELEEAFARGIVSAGGNAVVAGVLPTPAVALLTLDLGAVISASHNPPEYNGVKLFDREGQTLGRLATRIADTLRGKGKPAYTPHVDTGDFVVVVNAEKIQVTGNKLDQKRYYRHSGYPGGLRERPLREELRRRPTEVLRKAVKGMLPRNRLARAQIKKLKIYAGPEHPHEAQAPTELELNT